jgi:hypothetical protein
VSGARPLGQAIRQYLNIGPAVYAWGIDYSFGSGITVAQLQANKVEFVCRYLSGGHAKDINLLELTNLRAGKIDVVLNWETSGAELGFAAGAADATAAIGEATALGFPMAPIIFSPWDANPAGYIPGILDYMRGVVSVRGKLLSGLYQGYPAIKAYFDAGIGKYGWQTYAWSNGAWDPRAQLQQYQNNVTMGPATVDRDRAMATDFGQVRVFVPPPPPPLPPPPKPRLIGTKDGPAPLGNAYIWHADGTASLLQVAVARGSMVIGLIGVSSASLLPADRVKLEAYVKAGVTAPMPAGLAFCTHSP